MRLYTAHKHLDAKLSRNYTAKPWFFVLLAIALGLIAGLALCWKAGWMP